MAKRSITFTASPEANASWRARMQTMHRSAPVDDMIGNVMRDGTVFAGISPDTGKAMFLMPVDDLSMRFLDAAGFRARFNSEKKHGHGDWRLPSLNELRALYDVRDKGALSSAFNKTLHAVRGWYWAENVGNSTGDKITYWQKSFLDGQEKTLDRNNLAMACFVRS